MDEKEEKKTNMEAEQVEATVLTSTQTEKPAYGGPIGAMIGQYVGEKVGSWIGDTVQPNNQQTRDGEEENDNGVAEIKKRAGGGCSGGSEGDGEYKASDGQCHKTPEAPKQKLVVEENTIPENWWDKLPDFDPRVYDAIAMEQAAACVKYVFDGLPDMHDLENMVEAKKHRKICPRLKADVPRTKIIKPKEVVYETTIDSWIKKDKTY